MQRNLRLYLVYQVAHNGYFWLPVFFLYFSSILPAGEVLLLEAIYFFAVVVLEVPSGYFSDRIGRRLTLLISAGATVAAGALFALTASFSAFVAGQALLAVAMSFNSGTDSALLYDSLDALDRGGEIGEMEARAHTWGFAATATAALIGGALAGWDLRLAYVLSGLSGLVAFGCAWQFVEPPRSGRRALPPAGQLRAVLARLRNPLLAWLFAFSVVLVVVAHVPYEFFQPYLAFLFADRDTGVYAPTPLIAGLLVGAATATAALASTRAMALDRRLGTRAALLGALALEGFIIAVMGCLVHPLVIALIALRSVPVAVSGPIVNARIHPRVQTEIRATYLSVQSLAGRLAFSAALALASSAVGGAVMNAPIMSDVLLAFAGAAALCLAALAVTSRCAMR